MATLARHNGVLTLTPDNDKEHEALEAMAFAVTKVSVSGDPPKPPKKEKATDPGVKPWRTAQETIDNPQTGEPAPEPEKAKPAKAATGTKRRK